MLIANGTFLLKCGTSKTAPGMELFQFQQVQWIYFGALFKEKSSEFLESQR